MIKYAIAGNIASGKSAAEKILKNSGLDVYDTDLISHKILNTHLNEIKNLFKDYDILTDGKIDRKKLGKIVFSDDIMRNKLEEIIHPAVREELT